MLLVLALSLCLSLAGCSDEPDSAKQTIDDLTEPADTEDTELTPDTEMVPDTSVPDTELSMDDTDEPSAPETQVTEVTTPTPACAQGEACDTAGEWCEGPTCESSCGCSKKGAWVCGAKDGGGCGSGDQVCTLAGGCETCSCIDGKWSCEEIKKPTALVADEDLPKITDLELVCPKMTDATVEDALQRRFIKDAEARKAICNDGTPGAYYIRPGSGDNANKWIIYLKGGAACNNYCACRSRWLKEGHEKMSSSCWEKSIDIGGIFRGSANANPEFHDWSIAYVRYCTSDASHNPNS